MISVSIRRDNPLTSRFPRSASLNASSWCGIGWLRLSRLNQKNKENQVRFCPPIFRVPNRLTRLWWGPMKVVLWMERPICARMRVMAMAMVRKCATKNRTAIQSSIPPRIANQMRNIPPNNTPKNAVPYRIGSLSSSCGLRPIACRNACHICRRVPHSTMTETPVYAPMFCS